MTGPEHFQRAEELLRFAEGNTPGSEVERYHLAAAQVHATLALTAATALNDAEGGAPVADYKAWIAVAGVPGGR